MPRIRLVVPNISKFCILNLYVIWHVFRGENIKFQKIRNLVHFLKLTLESRITWFCDLKINLGHKGHKGHAPH